MERCLVAELELVHAAIPRRPVILAHATRRALASVRYAVAETSNLSRAVAVAVNKVAYVV